MLSGLITSLIMPVLFPSLQPLYSFPYILLVSLIGSILGTLLTPMDDEQVVMTFYKQVRPWGVWGPIRDKVMAKDPDFKENTDFSRDAFNIVIGVIWQLSLVVMPIYLVIKEFVPLSIGVGIFLITSLILKKNWLAKLENS